MTIIKATLYSYYEKESITFYFYTRKSKIKVSKLVDEISKHLPISADFSKEQYYSKTIKLEELFYANLENGEDRYRIILPLNYTLKLDSKEYKELYNNVINSLPFEVDAQCGQRAKKWLTNPNAQVHTTEGELFDILPFIPKTSKNEEREKLLQDQSQMDNLERWVINNTGDGNRNNMLLRFAMILVDAGFSFDNIKDKVISLNNKMADKLDEIELYNTIFHSVAAKLTSIA